MLDFPVLIKFCNIETYKMDDQFKFSVGVPAYKGRYLADCIASILNQTYPVFELVIVNDASPDAIDEIVGKFDDKRIHYSKNAINEGAEFVATNYNRCLQKATGNFFILMGDDDTMEPDYLEQFVQLISKYPHLDIFHCRSKIIDGESKVITYTPSWPEYESLYDNIWHKVNNYRVQFIADYVYRTSALKQKGGFYYMPLGWFTDDITSYIAMMGKGIAHTNKTLLNYRDHGASISSIGDHMIKMRAINQQKIWFDNFLKHKPVNDQDRVLYTDICQNTGRFIRKHKCYAISSSLEGGIIKNSIKWFNKRKEYGISAFEIINAIVIFLKVKRGAKKVNARAQSRIITQLCFNSKNE